MKTNNIQPQDEAPQWVQDIMKLPTLKEQRQAFLDNTVAYYSENTEERRCELAGSCYYSPDTVGRELSEGCAVGRALPKSIQKLLDKEASGDFVHRYSVWDRLPEYMQNLGKDFLSKVQQLHDREHYWEYTGENGLSRTGIDKVQSIINDFIKSL